MAWIYCDCGAGLNHPTDREVLTDGYPCPNCGKDHSNRIDTDLRAEAVGRVLDRLEIIEKQLGITPPE